MILSHSLTSLFLIIFQITFLTPRKENKISIKITKEFETDMGYGSKIAFLNNDKWISAESGILNIWNNQTLLKSIPLVGYNADDLLVNPSGSTLYAWPYKIHTQSDSVEYFPQLNDHLIDNMPEGSNAQSLYFGIKNLIWDKNEKEVIVYTKYFPPRSIDKSYSYHGPKGRVLLLDAESGVIKKNLYETSSFQENYVLAINDQFIVAGGIELMIWSRIDFKLIKKIENYTSAIKDLKFDPSGHYLALAKADGTVELLNTTNWNAIKWKAHKHSIQTLEFQPATKLLLTGGEDRMLKVWDYSGKTTKEIKRIPFSNSIEGIHFDSSGKKIVVSTREYSDLLYFLNVEVK